MRSRHCTDSEPHTQLNLAACVADNHPEVQRHAISIAGKVLAQQSSGDTSFDVSGLLKSLDEQSQTASPAVAQAIAFALGGASHPLAHRLLGTIAEHDHGPLVLSAVLSSATQAHLPALIASAHKTGNDALLSQLIGTAIGMGADSVVDAHLAQMLGRPFSEYQAEDCVGVASLLAQLASNATTKEKIISRHEGALVRLAQDARAYVADTDASIDMRVAAAQLLGHVDAAEADDLDQLDDVLTPQQPIELQRQALESLARIASSDTPQRLLARWQVATPQIQRQFGTVLLQRPEWTIAWLEDIQRGNGSLQHLSARQQQQLLQHESEDIRKRAEQLLAASVSSRQEVVAAYAETLTLTGDTQRGRGLFAKHCATCHRLDGVGNEVGADLNTVATKPKRTILESILDPSRAVEDRFLDYAVTLSDGRVVTGILIEETSTSVTIRDQEGTSRQIPRGDIEQLRSMGRSFMPEGLEKDLQTQDISDIIAYLQTDRVLPKPFDGNTPQIVKAGDDAPITLPATHCRIYGPSLVFESQFKNLGFWQSVDDVAAWTLEMPTSGSFQVVLEYACHTATAGNAVTLSVGPNELTHRIPSTDTWENYQELSVGKLSLDAGMHEIRVFPRVAPSNFLMDLRGVKLIPTAE